MSLDDLPEEFPLLSDAAIAAIRRAYDINAERHDPEAGDDAVVFGIAVYRNSWFLLEREVEALEGWTSARPCGSLLITGSGLRVHVYRHGQNADVDIEAFRLDDARASATQRLIAESNTMQLVLPMPLGEARPAPEPDSDLAELVIIHAGNPDDGCCAIWIGAPIKSEEITTSPWAWIASIWTAEPIDASGTAGIVPDEARPRHYELPEPEIVLEAVEEDDVEER